MAAAAWPCGAHGSDATLAGELDAIVAAAPHPPGVQVAVAKAGRIVYSRGHGVETLDGQTPVSPQTVFRIGSLTKQFTAAAILRLAQEKALALDAPVAEYLPRFARLPKTTLLELMNHTAGLHSDDTDAAPARPSRPPSQIDLATEIAAQKTPLDFPAGSAWRYSNANYVVLGGVIESVAKRSLANALQSLVLEPAGLRTTAFDRVEDVVSHRAKGYAAGDAPGAPFIPSTLLDVAEAGGAGAMRSSAEDLCRWHDGLLSGIVLSPQSVRIMTSPGRLRDGRLASANRFLAEDANYGDTQYGCGLLISGPSDPNPSILHYGYIGGFSSMLQTYLRSRVTLAVLCNADPGPYLPFRAMRKAVVAALVERPR